MRYSLVSRDIIADSIEAVCNAQHYDALIAVPGCDKNMPGSIIAMGRLNRPAIMVYGGTIAPGHHQGKDLNIVSAFEALGQNWQANYQKQTSNQSCSTLAPDPVPVEVCIRPIQWQLPSKHWA